MVKTADVAARDDGSPTPSDAGRGAPAPRPIGRFRATALLVRSVLLDIAHKLIKRRRRVRDQVTSDYDQGEWMDHLRARRWELARNLDAYVIPDDSRRIVATVDHRLVDTTVRQYYEIRTQCLADTLRRFAGDANTLYEIGSGAGRNLFALARDGRWSGLRGLELSKTGIEVTRQVAAHYGVSGVSAASIDLLDPASSGFAELTGATAFSFYCLEQLPEYTEVVMCALARAGVKRVIHMEPTSELMSYGSVRDWATISYIWRQHYLNDIVAVARRLESQGTIRVVAIERLGFAPTLRNAPTLVVWEPMPG